MFLHFSVYNKNMNIRQKIKELPTDSGVYIMKNATGEIIYIGKAKNLKNRVRVIVILNFLQIFAKKLVKIKYASNFANVKNCSLFLYLVKFM